MKVLFHQHKMIPEGLDIVSVSKLSSQIVEQVTCIECCKYYIAPETATCGHTLCHGCWSGRRSCPYCSAPFNRRTLKLNNPLKTLTENIHMLVDAHEKLFNVKLDEFELFVAQGNMQSDDPTKNVQDWLASSQNHFSAQVLSSQQSPQDVLPNVELSASNIQIHTHTKKNISPVKVIHAAQPQVDWDKIETLPNTEEICAKSNENIIGPMDLEPFFIDDNEYTTEKPRRSSRKRELKSDTKALKPDLSGDKHSSKNSSSETEKKSLKSKQNWSNVKKMRKEFSKLNKINRNKLNVSIEMCKKTQSTISKNKTATPAAGSQQVHFNIDENTPDLIIHNEKHVVESELISANENVPTIADVLNIENHNKYTEDLHKPTHNIRKITNSISHGKEVCNDITVNKVNNIPIQKNISTENSGNKIPLTKSCPLSNSVNVSDQNTDTTRTPHMPFLKKSALHQKSKEDSCVRVTQNEISSNDLTSNTDDIEISIKIGNTITNIFIKKKQNDVQLKLNTDREIQTTLGPYPLSKKNDVACSPLREITVQNIEDENKVSISKSTNTKKNTASADTATVQFENTDKSTNTKKNTASADTATVQFEITDSVEKELSKVMEQVEPEKTKSTQNLLQSANSSKIVKQTANEISIEDMEYLNDVDIFDSGSVKESGVQLLKNTKHIPSEILMPTLKNKKFEKPPDKRDREDPDEYEMPSSKKQKIDLAIQAKVQNNGGSEKQIEHYANDSEHITYDALMGQVFANIDADIQNNINNHSKKLTQTIVEEDKNTTEFSQIIHKTQHKIANKETSIATEAIKIIKETGNAKYSENVFSLLERDSEPHYVSEKNKQLPEPGSTQERIENMLTPGICRDLASTHHNSESAKIYDVEIGEPEPGTPLLEHDDSDKSVVEETPQKNPSFIKPKTTETKQMDSQLLENKTSDSQIIRSVINISDTSQESGRVKDITAVEINKRKPSLETPLTINKFVNHIKHNSTPVVRKSLNFDSMSIEDPEQTLCPTTTQEKEFLAKAFEQTPVSPVKKPLSLRNAMNKETAKTQKYCVAGSCLTAAELVNVKLLCRKRGWDYVDKYTQDLTHLVVGVDEENKSQRSVKYMCSLAASKWIISYRWIEQCLTKNEVVDEAPYEALDACGDPGPRRSRLAQTKLFEGITFYCMPPFSVLELETLKHMLQVSGGRIVNEPQSVRVSPGDVAPALLLAEPEHTQENRFIYMAMELNIVPVNYEWALNCLGAYSLGSIHELLLCPASLLPAPTAQWPAALMQREGDDDD